MRKKTLFITLLSVVAVTLISGAVFINVIPSENLNLGAVSVSADTSDTTTPENDVIKEDKIEHVLGSTYIPSIIEGFSPDSKPIYTDTPIKEEPFVPATEMDLDPSSITIFVNKEYSIPKDYKPKELVVPDIYFNFTYIDERALMHPEAAAAIEQLFLAAEKEGYKLSGVSGYRSYERQYKIFTDNIVAKGKEHTLKYSAVPGTSEHQTGLAMDISSESLGYELSSALANTPEGQWLAENAYQFGFIIRYPKGKAKITGYAYEPWHIRYVGKGLATYLYTNNLTLDEYYKYKPSKDFDFEALYADLINYMPSVTPLPTGGAGFVLGENGEIIDVTLGEEINQPVEGDLATDGEAPDTTDEGSPSTAPLDDGSIEATPSEGADSGSDGSDLIDYDPENNTDTEDSQNSTGIDTTTGENGLDITPAPIPTPIQDISSDSTVPDVSQ